MKYVAKIVCIACTVRNYIVPSDSVCHSNVCILRGEVFAPRCAGLSDWLLPPDVVLEPAPGSVGSRRWEEDREEDWLSGFWCPGSVAAEDADPSGTPMHVINSSRVFGVSRQFLRK